ncbi:hypothetical protein [Aquabacterium sp.]|jgi:ABC-type phosphate transport system substrate-binding protein|uniref:hypothetical protein n=1 Tax=Aquabacterium TaxID=92793 RepID=UPI0025BAC94C|nr:hypothetical protein [Aquabacterium sp.]|tara:strand:- start:346 stop:792 length:447 start_codon:yes stop_codon:yes gene_type:complete
MRCPPFLLRTWLMLGCLLAPGLAGAAVVIVAHGNVRKLDVTQVQRIYTGRLVELAGQALLPVNQAPGSLMRQRFLNDYLQQDEDRYTAYWTVRRYVGKGVPPRELASVAEVIAYIANTPGAIAYLDDSEVPAGMNVVATRPTAASGPR